MATGIVPALAADGGDPRMPDTEIDHRQGPIPPWNRGLHDHTIRFEEYQYYAALTRAEEETAKHDAAPVGLMQVLFPTKAGAGVKAIDVVNENRAPGDSANEKEIDEKGSPRGERITIADAEWTNASRAVRTATGAACFYLITTDILGPFGIGYETLRKR